LTSAPLYKQDVFARTALFLPEFGDVAGAKKGTQIVLSRSNYESKSSNAGPDQSMLPLTMAGKRSLRKRRRIAQACTSLECSLSCQ